MTFERLMVEEEEYIIPYETINNHKVVSSHDRERLRKQCLKLVAHKRTTFFNKVLITIITSTIFFYSFSWELSETLFLAIFLLGIFSMMKELEVKECEQKTC